jgi:hypothetical protein
MGEVREILWRGGGAGIKSIILLDSQPSPACPSYKSKVKVKTLEWSGAFTHTLSRLPSWWWRQQVPSTPPISIWGKNRRAVSASIYRACLPSHINCFYKGFSLLQISYYLVAVSGNKCNWCSPQAEPELCATSGGGRTGMCVFENNSDVCVRLLTKLLYKNI